MVDVWCLPLLANKIDKQQSDIAGWQSAQTITTTQLKNGLFAIVYNIVHALKLVVDHL